ncbi:hypothetical protein BD289DRAFT_492828 [Coniella lustricola]|uniref:Transcription factor domain-containing protein n=1 Tax=Coniella lustricola TaxID=2025994 RepID=A0A2T2ZXB0_9PEZI|nr:hypothetical protein BD289DRAFT_492828 [Coniella lustricola]
MIERVIWGQEAFGGGFCGSGADESQTSSTAPWRGLRKGSLRTLGTIESLMILTEWHPRALHFPPSEAIDELMVPTYESSLPSDDNVVGGQQQPPAISMGGRRVESWLEPAWRSDRMCWMLLNAAMGLGYELGVFDNIDELLDSGAISRPEYEEEAYRLRADRIKRLILIYLSQLAGRLGWTNMVPENLRKTTSLTRRRPPTATAAAAGIGLEGTTPELDDAIIHCWAGISNAMHNGNERLFKSRKHTTDIIQTDRYVELLKDFQPMLHDWRIQFERYQLPPYIRHILTIEYEYVRIYVNSLSLQAVVERCATIASGQSQQQQQQQQPPPPQQQGGGAAGLSTNNSGTAATAAAAASESSSSSPSINYGSMPGGIGQLSPKTQDIYGKMPIGNIGGVSAADQEYIREVVEGSRNLLRTVVEGLLPDDYLKHAPVRTYFRIISGAMFLLKTFALGATRHDVEVSIRLMDATVEALRTCIVDDVHLGIRFADLLENLTMRLRNRFIYVANPVAGGQNGQGQGHGQGNGGQGQIVLSLGDGSADAMGAQHLAQQHGGLLGLGAAHEQGWPRIHAPERAVTPANISATPFDMPSNFAVPTGFGTGGPATPAGGILGMNGSSNLDNGHNSNGGHSGGVSNSGHGNNNSGPSATAAMVDLFGGDGSDWASGGPSTDLWFLPAGPAFFQNVAGPGDSGVGMSAEGINVGGMDLLDYMAMDQYPLDGGGGI